MRDNITWQVCSLELSKKLEELGVPQDSLFYWVGDNKNKMFISNETRFIYGSAPDLSEAEYPFVYSAFTVAELGEMLPKGSYSKMQEYEGKWSWQVHTSKVSLVNVFQTEMSEADARAKILIYLLKNNLINL